MTADLDRIRLLLDEIEERALNATPGPWEALPEGDPDNQRCDGIYGPPKPDWEGVMDRARVVETDSGYYPPRMPDALFIASARTDIPRLCAMLRKAVEALEEIAAYPSGGLIESGTPNGDKHLMIWGAREALAKIAKEGK